VAEIEISIAAWVSVVWDGVYFALFYFLLLNFSICRLDYSKELLMYFCYSDLPMTLQKMDLSCLQPLPPGQPRKFAEFLDQCMGFS